MKLAILIVLFFIALPWQLVAPVMEHAVITGPAEVKEEVKQAAPAPNVEEEQAPITVQSKPVAVVNPPPPKPSSEAPVEYTEKYVEELERAIHDRINAERARAGLNILRYHDLLAQIAASHSTDMAQENYFDHADENGCTVSCRVTNAGYEWRSVGENLFMLKSTYRYSVEDASAIIVQGWMGSEGHRRNVLHDSFTYEGIGVVALGDAIYATEVFTRPR